MKIAGVRGGKKNKGEPIELSLEKKILAAATDAVAIWADTYKDGKYLAFQTELKTSSESFSPKGDKLKEKWENNLYKVKGTFKVHLRDKVKDIMLEPRVWAFNLHFSDILDNLGLPELRVEKIEIKPN